MDNDAILGILIGGSCATLLLFMVALLIVSTIMKWPMGINLAKTNCGECGEPLPAVRVPKDLYETFWGGWTCEDCGCKNDKWGRPR